jgi:hypothetical protein
MHEDSHRLGCCRSCFGYDCMEDLIEQEYREWLANPVDQLEYRLWAVTEDLKQLLQKEES